MRKIVSHSGVLLESAPRIDSKNKHITPFFQNYKHVLYPAGST